MGSASSRGSSKSPGASPRRDHEQQVDLADRQWSCTTRHHLIHLISADVAEGELDHALQMAKLLNKLFGIGVPGEGNVDPDAIIGVEADENEVEHFVLDRKSVILMHNMIGFMENKPPGWKEQLNMICNELSIHVAPPVLRGSFPLDDIPIRELVLTCLDLYKTITKIGTVRSIIDRNRSITKIEMSYTGITSDSFKMLLPSVATLECLVFLGLKGNRLEKSIVTDMTLIMENPKKFRSLKWVDFRNNVDIFTVSQRYLHLLKERWDTRRYNPPFRVVAEESGRQLRKHLHETLEHQGTQSKQYAVPN
ncbi:leucine-rich repeat-containing protein 75A-like [Lineus longissimus]|uniref:leucine-rich repeat-containing protein 75A-like n=1 Tax=Lineus longissimus TaxID=88925 RepID=UPI00315DF75B